MILIHVGARLSDVAAGKFNMKPQKSACQRGPNFLHPRQISPEETPVVVTPPNLF